LAVYPARVRILLLTVGECAFVRCCYCPWYLRLTRVTCICLWSTQCMFHCPPYVHTHALYTVLPFASQIV